MRLERHTRSRILVVGINYWPEHAGIAPYTTHLAEYLHHVGHEVSVVTGVPHYPDWRRPDEWRTQLAQKEQVRGISVQRLRHYVPRTQSALHRGIYEATFAVNSYFREPRSRPDIVIGVSPALAGAAYATDIARRLRAPSAVIVQDLIGLGAEQSGVRGGRLVADLVGRWESHVLRHANIVAVIAEVFREPLHRVGVPEERITLLPNFTHVEPPKMDRAQRRRELGWQADQFVVLHSGNIGVKQGLENVVSTARLACESGLTNLHFVLMGDGNQRTQIEKLGREVSTFVVVDPVPDGVYTDTLAAADVLLVNERPSVQQMALPSKLTSYLAAGRPVVSCTAPYGTTAQEVARAGAGLVVPAGDPVQLLAAIRRLADNPLLAARLGAAGRRFSNLNLLQKAAEERIDKLVSSLESLSDSPSSSRRPVAISHAHPQRPAE